MGSCTFIYNWFSTAVEQFVCDKLLRCCRKKIIQNNHPQKNTELQNNKMVNYFIPALYNQWFYIVTDWNYREVYVRDRNESNHKYFILRFFNK